MDIKQAVKQTEYFLLDMDGTIYLDAIPIGDMKNTLESIRKSGRKIVFLTNNSSKTVDEYVKKLIVYLRRNHIRILTAEEIKNKIILHLRKHKQLIESELAENISEDNNEEK